MKTCPDCKKEVRDVIARCECGHNFPPLLTPYVPPPPTPPLRILGVVLIGISIVVTIYFAFGYDTSVEVSKEIASTGVYVPDRVENIGRQQNRLIGVLCGLTLGIAGTVLIASPQNRSR